MSVEKMQKKINVYYYSKVAIVFVLLISSIAMAVTTFISFLGFEKAKLWCIVSYVVMVTLVLAVGAFPLQFNLKKFIKKEDINIIFDYLYNFEGSTNKFLESLYIIKRTVDAMIYDPSVVNWNTEKAEEKLLNDVWNQMHCYLSKGTAINTNRENVKKFIDLLREGIIDQKLDYEGLQSIIDKQTPEKTIWLGIKFKRKVRLNVLAVIICSVILFALVVFKVVLVIKPDQMIIENILPLKLIYNTGTDIIAFFFALFAIKSEFKS